MKEDQGGVEEGRLALAWVKKYFRYMLERFSWKEE